MISVIIPIYNVEGDLERCLDSLLKQHNPDFEVLMVNDGSKDNSKEICLRYEHIDRRFKLINKPNGGVSSARNEGLRHATGEWIVFVDADDTVDEDYLTIPFNDTEYIDIIEKSYCILKNDQIVLSNEINSEKILYNNEIAKYYSTYILSNSAALWNKIIKREVINDSRFDESKTYGEDFLFFLSIFHRIKYYILYPKGKYYYIRRELSAASFHEREDRGCVRSLFNNLYSVKQITIQGGIPELGEYIIYNIYIYALLRKKEFLNFKDWCSVFYIISKLPFIKCNLLPFKTRKLIIRHTLKSKFKR